MFFIVKNNSLMYKRDNSIIYFEKNENEGRVFNVNDIGNIIESYSNIECMICETIENILLENEYIIIKEMIGDLEKDIDNTINKFKNNSKVYSEMNRSIEQMVYIKKGIRNKDYDLIIE